MQKLEVIGGRKISGTILISGSKNATLPILASTILTNKKVIIKNIPVVRDVETMAKLLKTIGSTVKFDKKKKKIEIHNKRTLGNEFIADISVMSSTLHGVSIPQNLVSIAIDEFPCIFIAAAVAKGKTVLENAAELRIKESDRIQVMAAGLRACGAQVETSKDGLVIQGGKLKGGTVNAKGDHRVAMAFAMASLATSEKIHISDTRNISIKFRGLFSINFYFPFYSRRW